jgi:predicted phosphodiesterase
LCNSNPNLSLLERIEKQTMKLRGKKKLMKIFYENNIRLVLHGHLHESCEYFKHRIHFLNAGASIENKNRNSFFLNDIEIINGTAKIDIRSINETKFLMSKELYLLDSSSIAVGANNIL